MTFFSNLINAIRGINKKAIPRQSYVFGSIISGNYQNYKTDPNPTILCLGCYMKQNGAYYVHGIQLHAAGGSLLWILTTARNIKLNSIVTNPRLFFNYLKLNNPNLIKNCYRTYRMDLSNFKTISPGFSNIAEDYCYPIQDERDSQIVNFFKAQSEKRQYININMDSSELMKNIGEAINTVKIW